MFFIVLFICKIIQKMNDKYNLLFRKKIRVKSDYGFFHLSLGLSVALSKIPALFTSLSGKHVKA